MRIRRVKVGYKDFTASEEQEFRKFLANDPTHGILVSVEAKLPAGTTTGGAWIHHAEIIKKLSLVLGEETVQEWSGRDLWEFMTLLQRVTPFYFRTDWAVSTTLYARFTLRIPLIVPVPSGVPINLVVETGALTDVFSGGTHTWSECKVWVYQDIWEDLTAAQREEMDATNIYVEAGSSSETLSGTKAEDPHDFDLSSGGTIMGFLVRERDNSALDDDLVTSVQLEYKRRPVQKEVRKRTILSDSVAKFGVAHVTGFWFLDLDGDGDGRGLLVTKPGQLMQLRVKHGAVTGTADLKVIPIRFKRYVEAAA